MNIKTPIYVAIALSAILSVSKVNAQTNVGQWDFKKGDLSATAGSDLGPLTYNDGPNGVTSNLTIFATTEALGIPSIGGVVTNVMRFPGATALPVGYLMPTPPANGGGSLVNDYTVIVDVLYTNAGVFRPILQMDNGSLDDILAFFDLNLFDQISVTNTEGATLPSLAFGSIEPNTWYRLGFVLSTDLGEVDVYTNGSEAGSVLIGQGQIDSPYALYSGQLPLFSSTLTNVAGFANSVQIRDTALNAGQLAALGPPSAGGIPITIPPVKTFVQYRDPGFNDFNVLPQPNFNVILNQGNTEIVTNSIELFLDGVEIPSTVTPTPPTFTITASQTNLMLPGSLHTATIAWTDGNGPGSNTWNFTVFNYQSINLPQPFYLETFDEVDVSSNVALPTGWYGTNQTTVQDASFDLCNPDSATYEGWLVDNTNFICGGGGGPCSGFEADTTNQPPIALNGALITSLASNNILFFESDNRCSGGCFGQAGFVFTPDIDCSAQSNVYVCFYSLWMQNRNSFGSLEYSTNMGTNWLPALYCIADSDGSDFSTTGGGGGGSRVGGAIIYTNGVIDVTQTFKTWYTDQAGYPNTNFMNDAHWMAAPVSTADIPFIQGFPDDGANYTTTGGGVTHSQWIGKEIEQIRLASADHQAHVRFRFGYTGRCSWYWGIDNFGLYSINTPDIAVQPVSESVDDNTSATFSVTATGAAPLTYQWQFDGTNIANATSSTYTISDAGPGNAGTYTVVVSNPYGPLTSDPATLTVYTTPRLTQGPVGEIADPGAAVTFTAAATGAQPLSYLWYFNDELIQNSAVPAVTLNNLQLSQAGDYTVAVSNSFGAVTSTIAILNVWEGPIASNLVVHLPFDGNFNDTSGQGNNASYATNGPDANPNPTFVPGKIGQAFEYTTTKDASIQEYATLGYPLDLQFGASNDFAVSMWVNYTNQSDDLPFICNKDWNSSSDIGWGVFCQSGGNYRINVTGPNLGADKYSETDTPTDVRGG
ncbi:MAG TPA: immunoglobulin domain-containing protein, partial [Verrucomicrobiae bacterium]|nr:immunoglobulin domain-containing protein [Verrucomicrobiae bacterium]